MNNVLFNIGLYLDAQRQEKGGLIDEWRKFRTRADLLKNNLKTRSEIDVAMAKLADLAAQDSYTKQDVVEMASLFREIEHAEKSLKNKKTTTQREQKVTSQTANESKNSIGMKFKPLTAGTFTMGGGLTAHQVTLTKRFEMGVMEVTQEQYEKVMGTKPSRFEVVAQNPVDSVNWDDAVEFCRKLSELPEEKAAGHVYRLPTEAEWEYACRAGTTTKWSCGDDQSKLGDYAWYNANSDKKTHPVGLKKPNAWGLYDMHGNVFEWCQDYYGKQSSDAVTDPAGPKTGSKRLLRGGSWDLTSRYCLSSHRFQLEPTDRYDFVGFRVVRVPASK